MSKPTKKEKLIQFTFYLKRRRRMKKFQRKNTKKQDGYIQKLIEKKLVNCEISEKILFVSTTQERRSVLSLWRLRDEKKVRCLTSSESMMGNNNDNKSKPIISNMDK